MKISNTITNLLVLAIVFLGVCACHRENAQVASHNLPAAQVVSAELDSESLNQRLKDLAARAGGEVGIAVVHVESGHTLDVEGAKTFPLYSVYKLPLAIAVLKEVEEKRLAQDKKVLVGPQDVAPGSQFNADLWRKPVEKTVTELIEVSIVRSDNTSSDKLLGLIGGPSGVTNRMRALGFANINVVSSSREFAANRDRPNTGTALEFAGLLRKLQKGELLQPSNSELLLEYMTRSKIGERRLRGKVPAGTPVADKTGTGGTTTNDVGVITLPETRGHLAIAVFINGSKLTTEAQEDVIADIGRAAYDSFVSSPAKKP